MRTYAAAALPHGCSTVQILRNQKAGCVRWIGHTRSRYHRTELSVGVALDDRDGDHDGLYQGVRYFRTTPGHAVIVKARFVAYVFNKATLLYDMTSAVSRPKPPTHTHARATTKHTRATTHLPRRASSTPTIATLARPPNHNKQDHVDQLIILTDHHHHHHHHHHPQRSMTMGLLSSPLSGRQRLGSGRTWRRIAFGTGGPRS